MTRPIDVAAGFNPAPSLEAANRADVEVVRAVPAGAQAVGVLVAPDGDVPAELALTRDELLAAGFKGEVGQALLVPGTPVRIAVGMGVAAELTQAKLRDAAAAFALAAARHSDLALGIAGLTALAPGEAAQAAVEGAELARYRYEPLKTKDTLTPLQSLKLVVAAGDVEAAEAGAQRGLVMSAATELARDLANAPPAHLTASRMAEIATELGRERGFAVEVFDRDALLEMGCGGLLGVNGGSVEPPRMVKLSYRPTKGGQVDATAPRLTFVGKGIMYDSGGISLKPADGTHATMKNDMSGAAAVLAAVAALGELGCTTAVTGYLMCTDNMPSGTALKMGDVLTTRGGTTVEVMNTDAEGRLVMSDGLVLATEEGADAIVDIATLTGAALRALGPSVAAVMGNDQSLVDQLTAASVTTDEPLWQLPLDHRYRSYLNSDIADIKNLGGEHAGAITAGLFLEEFVAGLPWAHLDIAGTAQSDAPEAWRPKGCTGFGARLLVELALAFTPPRA